VSNSLPSHVWVDRPWPRPVVRDTLKTARREEDHLGVPVLGAERPTVAEHDGWSAARVLVVDLRAVLEALAEEFAAAGVPVAVLDRRHGLEKPYGQQAQHDPGHRLNRLVLPAMPAPPPLEAAPARDPMIGLRSAHHRSAGEHPVHVEAVGRGHVPGGSGPAVA
jgi:hypothetical protein